MEHSKFDELTKALATATSRRQALKTIAAATIGSILALGVRGSYEFACFARTSAAGSRLPACRPDQAS
jgi:hypothetical protein